VIEMAGGMVPLGVKKERAAEYKGHMTFAVAMACIVAAIGGSIFGYDIGISGNIFMRVLFFPSSELYLVRSLWLGCVSAPVLHSHGPPRTPELFVSTYGRMLGLTEKALRRQIRPSPLYISIDQSLSFPRMVPTTLHALPTLSRSSFYHRCHIHITHLFLLWPQAIEVIAIYSWYSNKKTGF
jgi:hypothetical protein